jgi:ParB family chromosome partitioning protein
LWAATSAPSTRSAPIPLARCIIRNDEKWKAEQEKQRKEQAIANTTGIRVLKAIGDAVPVRLMKRDLLFVLMQTFPLLNERQLQTLARQHGIRKDREADARQAVFRLPASC